MPYKISFIGSGNVAWHLAKAFDRAGHTVLQVYSRNTQSANAVAQVCGAQPLSSLQQLADDIDALFLCVNDDAIKTIAPQLAHHKSLVVHTSGAQSIEALDMLPYYGVFYPVQTLNAGKEVNFYEVPVCIEGNSKITENILKALADTISNKVYFVSSEKRRYLHLAAVFANNFTNALYNAAYEIVQQQGLDFDMLRPLIKETADKVQTLLPADAQTGPARRHDVQTIAKHLELLPEGTDKRRIYELITGIIGKQ